MKKPILISIIPSAIITPLLINSKELISFSETAALILIGLTLIGLANIGRKKIDKN